MSAEADLRARHDAELAALAQRMRTAEAGLVDVVAREAAVAAGLPAWCGAVLRDRLRYDANRGAVVAVDPGTGRALLSRVPAHYGAPMAAGELLQHLLEEPGDLGRELRAARGAARHPVSVSVSRPSRR